FSTSACNTTPFLLFFFSDTSTTEIYTLSLTTLFRSACLGVVQRIYTTVASNSGTYCWSPGLPNRTDDLSAGCVWLFASPGILVLRGRSVPMDEAWLHGVDLPSGRRDVEALV